MGVLNTSDHIQIKIKMPNPSQEPPVSSKDPSQDLKDIDVLCTFKIKIETQNIELGSIKTSDPIIIKIKMPNPSQDASATTKTPNQDFNDIDVLCTIKIKIESQNLQYGCIKDQ